MFMRVEAPLTKSRHFAFRVLRPRVDVRFSCNRKPAVELKHVPDSSPPG